MPFRSLSADQLADTDDNTLPQQLAACDLLIVPVLLEPSTASSSSAGQASVGDTRAAWASTEAGIEDRNFDLTRAEPVRNCKHERPEKGVVGVGGDAGVVKRVVLYK